MINDIMPFEREGNWYKGNLHSHSTYSDGLLTPEKLAEIYKEKEYSFLAISDHMIFINWEKLNTNDFILIPAIENGAIAGDEKCFHIHGIQGSSSYIATAKKTPFKDGYKADYPEWQGLSTVQEMIDDINDAGNLVMFNHPVWSANELDDLLGLTGYFAVEIFNWGCESGTHNGNSEVYWDSLLRRGIKVWGIATDDNHNFPVYKDTPFGIDSFGGWVCVKAQILTHDNITDALLKGRFYSSSGPEIYNYGIKDGFAFLECSEAESICFITNNGEKSFRSEYSDGSISFASLKLKGSERYLRVTCTDRTGRRAWTNPIFET